MKLYHVHTWIWSHEKYQMYQVHGTSPYTPAPKEKGLLRDQEHPSDWGLFRESWGSDETYNLQPQSLIHW